MQCSAGCVAEIRYQPCTQITQLNDYTAVVPFLNTYAQLIAMHTSNNIRLYQVILAQNFMPYGTLC